MSAATSFRPLSSRSSREGGPIQMLGGPAKHLLAAAGEAGVDLADEGALKTFIASWNPRSATSRGSSAIASVAAAADRTPERGMLRTYDAYVLLCSLGLDT